MAAPENSPLNIVIAGAGIGGLTASIALRQAGHNVQIFERSLFNNEYGAAVSIGPNSNGLLRGMGMALEDFGGVATGTLSEFNKDGELVRSMNTSEAIKDYKHPWHYIHRVDLHSGLKKLATATSGKGKPVIIHLDSQVASVDPETATLTLENGKTYQADLVIGADGVHSMLRKYVDDSGIQPEPFGLAGYRFVIPSATLLADPQTARFVKSAGEFQFWSDGHKNIVMYPCRNGELLNCALLVNDDTTQQRKGWTSAALKAEMVQQFQDFHPDTLALVSKAGDVGYWPLFDMQPLNSWINGKVALLGDAAHQFLPFQGQGASQAIEDAITLAEILPIGQTTPADIPERLRLYQSARRSRVEQIQVVSRGFGKGTLREIKEKSPFTDTMEFNFSHDARKHAAELLGQLLEAKK